MRANAQGRRRMAAAAGQDSRKPKPPKPTPESKAEDAVREFAKAARHQV